MKRRMTTTAAAGLTSAATLALLTLTVAPALAAPTTAPYAPDIDSSAIGTITLYNSTGVPVVTSSGSGAFPMYAVGSASPRAGDARAILEACLPQNGVLPANWSCDSLNGPTKYPVTTGPVTVTSATTPVSTILPGDLNFDYIATEFPNTDTSTDGYAGLYQLREITEPPGGVPQSLTYDDAYLQYNSTADTFTVVYPVQTVTTPPPSLPEAPLAIGLPVAGVVAAGGVFALRRRRRAAA